MNRLAVALLTLALLVAPLAAEVQPEGKVLTASPTPPRLVTPYRMAGVLLVAGVVGR